jgi:hypothetical protein
MFIITTLLGASLSAWLAGRGDPCHTLERMLRIMVIALLGIICQVCILPMFFTLGTTILLGGILFSYAVANVLFLTPIQLVTPNELRARMSAVTSTLCVIPAGLGPVLIGLLTDHVFHNPAALDRAAAIVMGGIGIVGLAGGMVALGVARKLEADGALS